MSEQKFSHYFIAEDVSTASKVVEYFKQKELSDDDIAVVSRDEEFRVADLPQADLSEKSQLPDAIKRGALLGSGSGLLTGLMMATFPIAGVTVGGAALLAMTAGGAAFGSWSAGMIGISESSPLVKDFEDALDDDKTIVFIALDDALTQSIKSDIGKLAGVGKLQIGALEDYTSKS